MRAWSPRFLVSALLGLAAASSPAPASPPAVPVHLEVLQVGREGAPTDHPTVWRPVEVPLDGSGDALVRRIVEGYPGALRGQGESNLERLYAALREGTLVSSMARAASLSGLSRVRILFYADDSPFRTRPGEVLDLPNPATMTMEPRALRFGETLLDVATAAVRADPTLDDLAVGLAGVLYPPARLPGVQHRALRVFEMLQLICEANPDRFRIWAKAGDSVDDSVRERVIMLGEWGYRDGVDLFAAPVLRHTLVHEAAHLGDETRCAEGDWYGGDGDHTLDEIVTPYAAFGEGWANFQANLEVPEGIDPIHLLAPRASLYYQAGFVAAPKIYGEDFVDVLTEDLTVWDLVSNETYVARCLEALAEATSREAVEAAFVRIAATPCASLVDLIASLRASQPAADLLGALGQAFAGQDAGAYPALLEGRVPPGFAPNRILRRILDLRPTLARASRPAPSTGAFGQIP